MSQSTPTRQHRELEVRRAKQGTQIEKKKASQTLESEQAKSSYKTSTTVSDNLNEISEDRIEMERQLKEKKF